MSYKEGAVEKLPSCHCEEALAPTWQSQKFGFCLSSIEKQTFSLRLPRRSAPRNDILILFLDKMI